jgi:general stress protein 26
MFNSQDTGQGEDFKQRIIDFISKVEYSELITVEGDVPHIRPMVYVNRGLTIYMATRRNTAKVKQIRANPHVSVMIIKSFQEAEHTKEVIIEGTASFVTGREERRWVFEAFKKKPLTFQEWAETGSTEEYEVIKITPHLLKYFDYAAGEQEPKTVKLA